MQHLNKHACNVYLENIHLKKTDEKLGTEACNIRVQMKNWEQKLTTYTYNHFNICNISIYFCNIHVKHLQYTSETF
jgi:hypothetical protein